MEAFFILRENMHNVRHFQEISNDYRKTVKCGIKTISNRTPFLWAKLPNTQCSAKTQFQEISQISQTGRHLCQTFFLNKVLSHSIALLNKKIQQRQFSVNFLKFSSIAFSSNIVEIIRTVFNFYYFFYMIKFRKNKKPQIRLQQTKMKKYIEKTSKRKKVTYSLICALCFYLVVLLCFQCFQCFYCFIFAFCACKILS